MNYLQKSLFICPSIIVIMEVYQLEKKGEKIWFSKLVESLEGVINKDDVSRGLNTASDWLLIEGSYGEIRSGISGYLLSTSLDFKTTIQELYDKFYTEVELTRSKYNKYYIDEPFGYLSEKDCWVSNEIKTLEIANGILDTLREESYFDTWPLEEEMNSFGIYHRGKKVYKFEQINKQEKPPDIDEDGYSPHLDIYWGDYEYTCDYKLIKLDNKE